MSLKSKVQVVVAALDAKTGIYKILLLLTNENRGSFWQNVTGSVEKNESFEAAALRETQEETGLILEDIMDIVDLKIHHQFVDARGKKCLEHCFLIIADRQWKVKIDPHEHQDFHWCEMGKLDSRSVKHESNWTTLTKAMELIKRYVA
jgi:8-oxo-dGTP pyrophosphatase MutT (NUDIX family)